MAKLEPQKLITLAFTSIILLQIASLLLGEFTDIAVLKLGHLLLLIVLASGFAVLVNISFSFDKFKRETLFYLIIVAGIMYGLYVYLPTAFPQIFSIFRQNGFSVVVP